MCVLFGIISCFSQVLFVIEYDFVGMDIEAVIEILGMECIYDDNNIITDTYIRYVDESIHIKNEKTIIIAH